MYWQGKVCRRVEVVKMVVGRVCSAIIDVG